MKNKYQVYDNSTDKEILFRETKRIEYAFCFAYGLKHFIIRSKTNKYLQLKFDFNDNESIMYDIQLYNFMSFVLTTKQLDFFKKTFLEKEFI